MSDNDSITEVTTTSWFERIKSGLFGALVGLLLFIVAFPVLFWNEGRAVHRAKTLEEGAGLVISVDVHEINPDNESKLVHVSGKTATNDTLEDAMFGLKLSKIIKLQRTVEMYQWEEERHSETKEKLGGGTETVTTYRYHKTWSDTAINSSHFKQSEGHLNPADIPIKSKSFAAQEVKLGGFKLSTGLIGQLNNYQSLNMTEATLKQVPKTTLGNNATVRLNDGNFYVGQNPLQPQIGDLRIHFKVVHPDTVSVVAKQTGTALTTYTTKVGGTLEMLQHGVVTAAEMFKREVSANNMLTWGLRLGGFVVMFIGLSMIFNVLRTLTAVLPFLANIVGFITGVIALLISGVLSLITIALAWLFYRPLLAIGLLLVAGALLYAINFARKPQAIETEAKE